MSVTHVERVSISTPHQFAATLPALVGFVPASSFVIVMLRNSQVIVTMRCDRRDGSPHRFDHSPLLSLIDHASH